MYDIIKTGNSCYDKKIKVVIVNNSLIVIILVHVCGIYEYDNLMKLII